MVKWPPPIIIICPLKPSYFIVHNISISLIWLFLRVFQGFHLPPSENSVKYWTQKVASAVLVLLLSLTKLIFSPSLTCRGSLEGRTALKEKASQLREVKHERCPCAYLGWWRGLFPSRTSWAISAGLDEQRQAKEGRRNRPIQWMTLVLKPEYRQTRDRKKESWDQTQTFHHCPAQNLETIVHEGVQGFITTSTCCKPSFNTVALHLSSETFTNTMG